MNFAHYVAGRTIAVVGPAPLVGDQTADIDAHDIVYRVAPHAIAPGYGTRCDIAYLNGDIGRRILDPDLVDIREAIDGATWWVNKMRHAPMRPQGLQRLAHRPPNVHNPNAITGILWDLTHFHPASITVYGADLYAGGPGNAYADGYQRREPQGQAQGIILHRPWEQMHAHRAMYATGLIVGDARYVAAVTMPDHEYQAVIDSWTRTLEPLT